MKDIIRSRDPMAAAVLTALDRQQAREAEWLAQSRELERDSIGDDAGPFVKHCRTSTSDDYLKWVTGWLKRGGEFYGASGKEFADEARPFSEYHNPNWVTLLSRPPRIPSLYGSASLHVIVPRGILARSEIPNTFHGGCGHSTFYFMDGFCAVGTSADRVNLFADTRRALMGEDPPSPPSPPSQAAYFTPQAVLDLEHDLGIAGHEDDCPRCRGLGLSGK